MSIRHIHVPASNGLKTLVSTIRNDAIRIEFKKHSGCYAVESIEKIDRRVSEIFETIDTMRELTKSSFNTPLSLELTIGSWNHLMEFTKFMEAKNAKYFAN